MPDRVLLTRARDGVVVFVPPLPVLHETYEYLLGAGFRSLDGRPIILDLTELLIGAGESPPSTRIEFRDPIRSTRGRRHCCGSALARDLFIRICHSRVSVGRLILVPASKAVAVLLVPHWAASTSLFLRMHVLLSIASV